MTSLFTFLVVLPGFERGRPRPDRFFYESFSQEIARLAVLALRGET